MTYCCWRPPHESTSSHGIVTAVDPSDCVETSTSLTTCSSPGATSRATEIIVQTTQGGAVAGVSEIVSPAPLPIDTGPLGVAMATEVVHEPEVGTVNGTVEASNSRRFASLHNSYVYCAPTVTSDDATPIVRLRGWFATTNARERIGEPATSSMRSVR